MSFQKDDFFKKEDGLVSVIFLNNRLFFGKKLKSSTIMLRRFKKTLDKFVDLLAYIVAVLGFLAFFYWIYINFDRISANYSILFNFWKEESAYITFFLISLFFSMFVIYRTSEKIAKTKRIKRITEGKNTVNLDVSNSLDEEMLSVLEDAYFLARKLNQKEVSTLHLFWVLISRPKIRSLLVRLNISVKELLLVLKKYLKETGSLEDGARGTPLSDNVQEILLSAFKDAYTNKNKAVGVLNIILFCYQRNEILQEVLYELEISQNKIENTIKWFRINEQIVEDYKIFRKLARLKPGGNMNKSYTAVATPTLDYFSRDLTLMAKLGYFEICVSREKEMKQIFDSFESEQSGVILVGQNGVGKRSLIEGLARLMVKEEVPRFLKDKRLVEIDLPRLISGASATQAEERMLRIIHEVIRAKNVILYIENIQTMMGISVGSEESLELSEVLAESLRRGDIYCLASASEENYVKYLEGRALANVMAPVKIEELDVDGAICVIESKIAWIESKYGVYFDYHSIEEAVNLSKKYINDRFLPEKALHIVRAVAVRNSKLLHSQPEKKMIAKTDIALVVSEMTGIPADQVSQSESEKLLNLEDKIHERMIGQEEAVRAVSGSLRRARAQMREGSRPIASFLFLGPTGVGKTELAKTVSDIYFGSEKYMIRLDMSEYQMKDSVKKMIGDVDGSIGYLTEAVRKAPFSLILFDEIEKAHPDILNLFLQVLDDGRLTDGQGRTINFTNSIIIATSNAGALYIQDSVKDNLDISIIRQELIDVHLNKVMRPELINRFDGIIVFKPLSEDNIFEISKIMVSKIAKNLEKKGISLAYDDAGLHKLAMAGYDPKFGARPLRRLLQDRIENELANLILSNKLKRRDIVFINENSEIEIEKGRII